MYKQAPGCRPSLRESNYQTRRSGAKECDAVDGPVSSRRIIFLFVNSDIVVAPSEAWPACLHLVRENTPHLLNSAWYTIYLCVGAVWSVEGNICPHIAARLCHMGIDIGYGLLSIWERSLRWCVRNPGFSSNKRLADRPSSISDSASACSARRPAGTLCSSPPRHIAS